jgi:putative serine protease PepD
VSDHEQDPWSAPDQRSEPTQPLSRGHAWASPSAPVPDPQAPPAGSMPPPLTTPSDPPQDRAYGQPQDQPYGQPQDQPPAYGGGYGAPGRHSGYSGQPPAQGYPQHTIPLPTSQRPTRGRLSGWVWPMIAVLSLLLGIGGGVLGALLVTDNGGDGSGGVLKVEKRTAAPLPADNKSIAAVADQVLPSTVQIIAEFEGDPRGATGSGFVLDKQGHVITNNHVVAEAAKDDGNIEIVDRNGKHSKATVVGRSLVYDIAVLKSDGAKGMTPAKLGSSEQMRVGETVVAIGSPLGLSSSVTSGIISALDRPVTTGESEDDTSYINAVQTDAAINPGNSGGPLVDLQGQVVGVNSAIASIGSIGQDQGGNIGVGFAIPIEQVVVTADQILKTGKAEYPIIGANVQSSRDVDGAEITGVTNGQPAEKAGLRSGDLVVAVDGKTITSSIDLVVAIRSHVKGDHLRLTVKRGSDTEQLTLTLDARSD